MGRLLNIVTPLHRRATRDYLGRMNDDKVACMKKAREFGPEFWDGDRRFGYGGYHYDGRWEPVAKKLLETYHLPPQARILDIGCGKGFLLHEIKTILPEAEIRGFDVSSYAIENAKEEIRDDLFLYRAEDPLPFGDEQFDLVISLGTLHNLGLHHLMTALNEMNRVGRNQYLMVESFRNVDELFNLQCWALTCESFFRPETWIWLFGQAGYNGDYEFIYFE